MTLIYLGIAWLAGIFLSSLLNLPALFLTLVGLVPLVSLVLWRENPRVRLVSVCALALLLGAWRYSSTIPRFDESAQPSGFLEKGPGPMLSEATVDELMRLIPMHPAIGEAMVDAAMDVEKRSLHLPY